MSACRSRSTSLHLQAARNAAPSRPARLPGAGSVRNAQADRRGPATHSDPPAGPAKEALRLLDEEPALDEGLLKLGRWISTYYCAPLGETLRAMTPLAGDIRRGQDLFADAIRARRRAPVAPDRDRAGRSGRGDSAPAGRPPALGVLSGAESPQGRRRAAIARKEGLRRSRKTSPPSAILCEPPPRGCAWSSSRARDGQNSQAGARAARLSRTASRPAQSRRRSKKRCRRPARRPARWPAGNWRGSPWSRCRASLRPPRAPHTLNPHQQEAFDAIRAALEPRANSKRFCSKASPDPARPKCT